MKCEGRLNVENALSQTWTRQALNRITIREVAEAAGVSIATVSRVLNAPARVNPDLRRRVTEAVDRLGYVAVGAARALASRRTGAIGALVPTLDNAIFAECINALQLRLDDHGYVLLVASADYDARRESRELKALVERGIDGVVLVGTEHDPEVYRLVQATGVPAAITWSCDPAARVPCIGFDNRAAARRLCQHLLELGHRDIAMLAGLRKGNDRAASRVDGVRDALQARGLDLPPERLCERPYTVADGRNALRQLLSAATRPTAVICGNDVLAFGALFEAAALGLRVPDDLSITGFDDLDLAAQMVPPLTTVRVPAAEMGRRAADQLVGVARGEPAPRVTELEAAIVLRGSTGAPPSRLP
jgi:LacI family transcriptional regulator